MLVSAAVGCSSSHTPPPGASPAFTSQDPDLIKAKELYEQGEFTKAKAVLAQSHADPRAVADMKEIIRRRAEDFTTTPEDLVARMRKKDIPDVTAADLDRWRADGALTYRIIDGKLLYFDREPQGLYLFSKEAKERKEKFAGKEEEKPWKLTDHLARIVAEAEKTGQTLVVPVKHHVTYTLTVEANRPGAKKGSQVRVWLPFPQEYRQQKDVKLISSEPASGMIAPNAISDPNAKNAPITGAAQRTIYFEKQIEDPSKPMTFKEELEFVTYAYYPKLSDDAARPLPADFPAEYTAERPPHIVFTPEIKALSASLVGKETNPLIKARKIYYWVSEHIAWHPEEEYCTIPSLPLKALSCSRGDCGIQSMTFITLCRSAGIPARWQTCWETKPVKDSMHDWCEIYIEPWGWLPCDPSYGLQKDKDGNLLDNLKIREFYLGHQDSYRLISNLDYGSQLFPPKKSFRSEPLDFQRGEVEIDGRNLYFDEWNYKMKFETTPPGI